MIDHIHSEIFDMLMQLTHILNIKYPIIQAPMAGGATTPELAAGYLSPTAIKQAIASIRKLTNKPFAINLFIPEKYHASAKQIHYMQALITH